MTDLSIDLQFFSTETKHMHMFKNRILKHLVINANKQLAIAMTDHISCPILPPSFCTSTYSGPDPDFRRRAECYGVRTPVTAELRKPSGSKVDWALVQASRQLQSVLRIRVEATHASESNRSRPGSQSDLGLTVGKERLNHSFLEVATPF